MPHNTDPEVDTKSTITAIDSTLDSSPTAAKSALDTTPTTIPERLPYWLVNVPRAQWPPECPAFLRDLPPKNIQILATPDEVYSRQNWETVRELVRTNRIDGFQRLPSDLRKYLEFTAQIKLKYGSVVRFVVRERLHWGNGDGDARELAPRGRPFKYDDDIKILYNDWPYGIDEDIIHLVVWVKFPLEVDPATDDLTPQAAAEIEAYVQRMFGGRVPREQLVWFKNWASLKSVHAVEHFHVMLHQPDAGFVEEITRGDVPLIARVSHPDPGYSAV